MAGGNVLVSVFWGSLYVETFFRWVLPSLMEPGNFEILASLEGAEYYIYTAERDMPGIDGHPGLARLRRHIPITVKPIRNGLYENHPHSWTRLAHKEAIRLARIREATVWFLQADVLYSKGALRVMRDVMQRGFRTFLAMAPRVHAAAGHYIESDPDLAEPLKDGILSMEPRQLARMILDIPSYQNMMSSYADSPLFDNVWPAIMLWKMGENAMLCRCSHICPLVVHPEIYCDDFEFCIDGDFISKAIKDWRRIHVSTDSDQCALASLSPNEPMQFRLPSLQLPMDTSQVARFLATKVGELERAIYFSKPIVYHDGSGLEGVADLVARQEAQVAEIRRRTEVYKTLA